jgi:Zn-dependent protease
MSFSLREIRDLVICWIVLSFCFSVISLLPVRDMPYSLILEEFVTAYLPAVLIAVGTGFLCHELAHKAMSHSLGFRAEFRLWKAGLIISIVSVLISFGQFLFLAPGAVYTYSYRQPTDTESGLMSFAGPLMNLALAALFYVMSLFGDPWNFLGYFGFRINLWLGAFNLLPIPPLDGIKVLKWNKIVWTAAVAVSWGIIILMTFGVVKI